MVRYWQNLPTNPKTNSLKSSPRHTCLADWLTWVEQAHPSEIDLGLNRITTVANRLDIPSLSKQPKIITVAGTNGKGSCVATLEALFSTQKCQFGSYTSPHFLRYNERIKINGQEVSDTDICHAFHRIDEARGEVSLTYFEFSTLAALLIFCDAQLEYWILEVGLGGRLDATNIVDADIAIITPVDLDHQAWLGDTIEQVGEEKAGIIREGSLVVCCDPSPPNSVLEKTQALAEKSYFFGKNKDFWGELDNGLESDLKNGLKSHSLNLTVGSQSIKGLAVPNLPLPSVLAAVQVAQCLGLDLSFAKLNTLFQSLHLVGRNQQLSLDVVGGKKIRFLLDVAHNAHAARYLSKRLDDNSSHKRSAIFAVMADKDLRGLLSSLSNKFHSWFLCELNGNSRAAKGEELNTLLSQIDKTSQRTVSASVEEAINTIIIAVEKNESNTEEVIVFGSFFTVAEALTVLQKKFNQ